MWFLPLFDFSFILSQSMESMLWVFLRTGNKHLLYEVEELVTDNWFHRNGCLFLLLLKGG